MSRVWTINDMVNYIANKEPGYYILFSDYDWTIFELHECKTFKDCLEFIDNKCLFYLDRGQPLYLETDNIITDLNKEDSDESVKVVFKIIGLSSNDEKYIIQYAEKMYEKSRKL